MHIFLLKFEVGEDDVKIYDVKNGIKDQSPKQYRDNALLSKN